MFVQQQFAMLAYYQIVYSYHYSCLIQLGGFTPQLPSCLKQHIFYIDLAYTKSKLIPLAFIQLKAARKLVPDQTNPTSNQNCFYK